MARTVAQSHHRITYDARRPHLQPSAVTIRNTGGIRVLDKQASSSASSRQVSNSTEKAVIKAVAPLYKRILYPDSEPPRNLATAGAEVLDAQLYDLLALIVRGFILPWYTRISKERAFPLEVVRIVGCVLGRLETKLVGGEDDTAVDLVGIIAVSLPSILERHIRDYREAKLMEDSAYGAGAGPSATASLKITQFQAAFHSLQPHAGIYPSGRHGSGESESQPEKLPSYIKGDYLRAVVDALLKEVLPEEDYAAETERTVVREVIIGIILAGVLNKVSQPWFIHQLVIKLLPSPSKADSVARVGFTEPERATRLSFWQRVLAAPRTISVFLTSSGSYRRRTSVRNLSTPSISLAFRALRSQEPGRQILGQLECLTLALTTLFSSWLDRVIVYFLYSSVFTVASVSNFFAKVQDALFPDGHPAPSVPDPSEAEQAVLHKQAYQAVEAAIARSRLPSLLPGRAPDRAAEELARDLLDPFSDQYCNNHLIMFIIDLVVAKLCPHLVVK